MGQSSEMMIAESNRNEAREAFDIIRFVNAEIGTEILNTEDDDSAAVLSEWQTKLKTAADLIRDYWEKHQPEFQTYK